MQLSRFINAELDSDSNSDSDWQADLDTTPVH